MSSENTASDGEQASDQSRTDAATDDSAVVSIGDIDTTGERVTVEVTVVVVKESSHDGESHYGYLADEDSTLRFGVPEGTDVDLSNFSADDSVRLTDLYVEYAYGGEVEFTDETTIEHLDHEVVEISRV